jgi:hypothetical protein
VVRNATFHPRSDRWKKQMQMPQSSALYEEGNHDENDDFPPAGLGYYDNGGGEGGEVDVEVTDAGAEGDGGNGWMSLLSTTSGVAGTPQQPSLSHSPHAAQRGLIEPSRSMFAARGADSSSSERSSEPHTDPGLDSPPVSPTTTTAPFAIAARPPSDPPPLPDSSTLPPASYTLVHRDNRPRPRTSLGLWPFPESQHIEEWLKPDPAEDDHSASPLHAALSPRRPYTTGSTHSSPLHHRRDRAYSGNAEVDDSGVGGDEAGYDYVGWRLALATGTSPRGAEAGERARGPQQLALRRIPTKAVRVEITAELVKLATPRCVIAKRPSTTDPATRLKPHTDPTQLARVAKAFKEKVHKKVSIKVRPDLHTHKKPHLQVIDKFDSFDEPPELETVPHHHHARARDNFHGYFGQKLLRRKTIEISKCATRIQGMYRCWRARQVQRRKARRKEKRETRSRAKDERAHEITLASHNILEDVCAVVAVRRSRRAKLVLELALERQREKLRLRILERKRRNKHLLVATVRIQAMCRFFLARCHTSRQSAIRDQLKAQRKVLHMRQQKRSARRFSVGVSDTHAHGMGKVGLIQARVHAQFNPQRQALNRGAVKTRLKQAAEEALVQFESSSDEDESTSEDSDSDDAGGPWVPDYTSKPGEKGGAHDGLVDLPPNTPRISSHRSPHDHRQVTRGHKHRKKVWYTSEDARRKAQTLAHARAAVRMRVMLAHHFDAQYKGQAARRRKDHR